MLDEKQRLFQAVVDHPDAEAPREAYADALDPGDPRAAFIRLQLEASRARKDRRDRLYAEKYDAAEKLLALHRADWTKGLDATVREPRFYRGFVEAITMDAGSFLANGKEVYRAAPIRHVVLTHAKNHIRELSSSSLLSRLASLSLRRNDLDDDDLKTLLGSSHLSQLKILDLSLNKLTGSSLDALAESRAIPSLIHVNLFGNALEEPSEVFGIDGMTGLIVRESIALPPAGEALEAKYGRKAWLHGPMQLPNYPPGEIDV